MSDYFLVFPKWRSQDTKIDFKQVKSILEQNIPDFVRKPLIPDQYGRDIYAPAGRKNKLREYFATAQFILARGQYTSQKT